jgi:UDP-N-acetylmuramoylalanine--D-glutamate ligase
MAAYAAAKARIFGKQAAVMVINRDDPEVEAMVPPPVVTKGRRGKPGHAGAPPRWCASAWTRRSGPVTSAWWSRTAWPGWCAPATDPTIKLKRQGRVEEIHLQRLMPADALRIRGRHNAANALAALALATAIGCPLAPMLHGLREYPASRTAWSIGTVGGVEAFDDSKGTNVGATVAALAGPGRRQGAGQAGHDPGRRRQGPGLRPLAEPVAALPAPWR